jgi:hypothetical protein
MVCIIAVEITPLMLWYKLVALERLPLLDENSHDENKRSLI